jgi:amino acid adenylation domain-containing protein
LPDGRIQFSGRIDDQVKIRGYRIEPGEVRGVLEEDGAVKEAVVTVRSLPGNETENCLCAYVVPREAGGFEKETEIQRLKQFLARKLPGYMVPSYIIPLQTVPLTSHGKIDFKALPEPGGGEVTWQFMPPRNEIERRLADLWQEVLVYSPVGIEDNFFERGGHSLKATRLTAGIHRDLDVVVPLTEVFRAPTIRDLGRFIQDTATTAYQSIQPVETRAFYPCSPAQKRLFILQQMDPGSTVYNIRSMLTVSGDIHPERFEDAFNKVIARHESLRTSFLLVDGEPVQRVHREAPFNIGPIGPIGPIVPFDLSRAPLLRVEIEQLDSRRFLLMVDMHHIVSDGVSTDILINDFIAYYSGKELKPLRLQYKDIAVWQTGAQSQAELKKQEQYWLSQFGAAEDIPVLQLPYDFPRPAVRSFEGCVAKFEIPAGQAAALNRLAVEHGATLYMVLMAMFNVLLSRLSNQEETVVGSPLAGRPHADMEHVIGMFIGTLAVRYFPCGDDPFSDFLHDVKTKTLEAFENQEYPFEELVEKVTVKRDAGRNPLFDVMFVLQNMEIRDIQLPGMTLGQYSFDPEVARFDMTLTCTESAGGLGFIFEYCTKLFTPATMDRFAGYFKRIAGAVIEDPGITLSRIPLISPEEKHRLTVEFNDTEADYPRDKTLHRLFEDQARQTPGNIAVIGEQTSLTYYQLNKEADQLVRSLEESGIGPGAIVAIMMERTPRMIVHILAVLKAGAAYMPIDPDYPESRRQFMLKDSAATLLKLPLERINSHPAATVSRESGAYVIYTSGTTGKPKGTLIEHRNVVRLMFNSRFQFHFSERDRWTLFHSFCFDFSVWEMYGALLRGGALVLVPGPVTRDPALFLRLLENHKVTVLNQTPAAFYNLAAEALKHPFPALDLRYVIFGGDALKPAKLKEWRQRYPQVKLINMYGITETTVHVTFKEITGREIASNISNIGKPIPTLTVYIVDRHLEPQPIGVPGELIVGGDGVAEGYLNRPELTGKKFLEVQKPFYKKVFGPRRERLYRSGDLARWTSEGDMEYLGRIDHQVKIRGFRIELGEIENRLLGHEAVKEAVVIYKREPETQDGYLCAYVVLSGDFTLNNPVSQLREYLSGHLPVYMVPSYFVMLERIPLTPNGKVDRRALPEAEITHTSIDSSHAPRGKIEEQLLEIWSETLDIEKEHIGVESDFFELGGHSLKAIQAINAIHQELQVRLPVQTLFQSSTIALLAREIEQHDTAAFTRIPKQPDKSYYELSYSQKRLWVLQRKNPGSPAFNMSESVTLPEAVEETHIRETLQYLTDRHDSLRTSFREVGGDTVQYIDPPGTVTVKMETVDLSGFSGEEPAKKRGQVFMEERLSPFNLEQAPLLRLKLVLSGEGGMDIIFNMHHLISDGWSLELFSREFVERLETLKRGEALSAPRLPLQYRDFAVWHNQMLADREQLQPVIEFWNQRLSSPPPSVDLPYDAPGSMRESQLSAGYRVKIPAAVTASLRGLAGRYQTSLFTVLLAVFNLLLSFLRGQTDITLAFPGAARPHQDLKDVIGLFVNTLILRTEIRPDEPFGTFLERVRDDVMQVLEYQVYPMEMICDELNIKYPDISVFFNMQNTGDSHKVELEDFEPRHIDRTQDAKFPLVFYLMEFKNGMNLFCHYFKESFEPGTIEKIVHMYTKLLSNIVSDPGKPVIQYKASKKRRKISRR